MEPDCATEVWIATALLHQENPNEPGFRLQRIVEKAHSLNLAGRPRSGTIVEASKHAVATKSPSLEPNRYLTMVDDKLRRLYIDGDDYHPGRREGKVRPEVEELPDDHRDLIEWYDGKYAAQKAA